MPIEIILMLFSWLSYLLNKLHDFGWICQLRSFFFKVPEISVSKSSVDVSLIGNVYFSDNIVIDLILNGEQEEFYFDFDPVNAYTLSNNQILLTSFEHLSIYDENFKQVKLQDKINYKKFNPYGVALNLEKEIAYITDCLNHRIHMTDFKLNLKKSVGSQGTGFNQFDEPHDLCLLNNKLYVCDGDNNRIQVLSDYLEFLESLELDFQPLQIKPLNSMLAVQASIEIYFYNSSDLSFIQKYNHGLLIISQINSNIYGFNSKASKLFCYGENSNLCEEIYFVDKRLDGEWDGAMCELNGVLFMISHSMSKIIKFSKH